MGFLLVFRLVPKHHLEGAAVGFEGQACRIQRRVRIQDPMLRFELRVAFKALATGKNPVELEH